MGKRSWSFILTTALIAGVFSAVPAKADGGSDVKFSLRSTGCSAADVNFDYLSITDEDDAIECNYTGSGIRNEIGDSTGTIGAQGSNAVADRATATRYWDTTDGVPLTLDASRPVTGQIFTSGAACAVGVVPCSPAGVGAGEVILDVTLVGTVGGEEKELGTQQDTFNAAPGAPHLTELSIQPDATFTGVRFDTIELRTWIHGVSAGQGVVKTNGDASSFISVPTAGISVINPPTKPTPPGKNSPPGKGKKKGCGKGKGKQNGACPKPGASACVPYVPGEEGKEAKTTVVTDAATAEKPVEVDLTAGAGGGAMPLSGTPVPYDETSSLFQNVQVDSQSPSTGLYARFEFADHHDYDFYLNYPDGSTAANSGDFNIAPGAGAGGGSPDGAWEAGSNYEQVMGIETADCAGYTARMVSYLTTGGDVKLKLWLGDVVAPPVPAGESQAAAADADALTNFYGLTGLANPSAPRMASAMSTPASNKGCTKGKGQKNGCKKSPVACKAFAPGERGADKPTLVATDAATEEAPLEQKITLAESVADLDLTGEIPDEGPLAASVEFFNVQVDTTSATTGLYMLFEFDERRDYDMDLLHVDGSYAARSHGFNTICGAPQPNCTNDGHGGEPTSNSEKLVGISTSDCGGWTTELTNWLGEGGEMTVKVWLGEVANEPLAPGEEPHA